MSTQQMKGGVFNKDRARTSNPNTRLIPFIKPPEYNAIRTCYNSTRKEGIFGQMYLKYKHGIQNEIILDLPSITILNLFQDDHDSDPHGYGGLKWKSSENFEDGELISSELYDTELANMVGKNNGYIVLQLGLSSRSGGHQNVIFYNCETKVIYRYEPNGSLVVLCLNRPAMDIAIANYFIRLGYMVNKYLGPADLYNNVAERMHETVVKREGDPGGFCMVWCLWFIDVVLGNPHLNLKDIHDLTMSHLSFDNPLMSVRDRYNQLIQLRDYSNTIRGYSKFLVDGVDRIALEYGRRGASISDIVVGVLSNAVADQRVRQHVMDTTYNTNIFDNPFLIPSKRTR
jgi:hypothetical protein